MTDAREAARLVYKSVQTSIDPIGVIREALELARNEGIDDCIEVLENDEIGVGTDYFVGQFRALKTSAD